MRFFRSQELEAQRVLRSNTPSHPIDGNARFSMETEKQKLVPPTFLIRRLYRDESKGPQPLQRHCAAASDPHFRVLVVSIARAFDSVIIKNEELTDVSIGGIGAGTATTHDCDWCRIYCARRG